MPSDTITIPAPLELHSARIMPEWIDYNGHMNDGCYVVAASIASDAFLDYVGLDAAYRAATHCTVYSAEIHVTYLRELKEGDPLRFTTQLLDHDARRMSLFHSLYHAEQSYLAATCEFMFLHVDQSQGRVVPMPPDILARLEQIAAAHAALPRPSQAGRGIGMARR